MNTNQSLNLEQNQIAPNQANLPNDPTVPIKKPRLPRWVKIVSFVFWIPFTLITLITAYLGNQASKGVSGTEYIAILLFPVVIALQLIGSFYIVLLLLYAKSNYPGRAKRILSLFVALALIGILAMGIVQEVRDARKRGQIYKIMPDSEVISLLEKCKVDSLQKENDKVNLLLVHDAYYDSEGNYLWRSTTASAKNWEMFVVKVEEVDRKCGSVEAFDAIGDPHISWISAGEANNLLEECKIDTFKYTPSGLDEIDTPADNNTTGIILSQDYTIRHLYIKPEQESKMIPIARDAQTRCSGPQFYHDGRYEQRADDGTWYHPIY